MQLRTSNASIQVNLIIIRLSLGSMEQAILYVKPYYNAVAILEAMTWQCYTENCTIVRCIIMRLNCISPWEVNIYVGTTYHGPEDSWQVVPRQVIPSYPCAIVFKMIKDHLPTKMLSLYKLFYIYKSQRAMERPDFIYYFFYLISCMILQTK